MTVPLKTQETQHTHLWRLMTHTQVKSDCDVECESQSASVFLAEVQNEPPSSKIFHSTQCETLSSVTLPICWLFTKYKNKKARTRLTVKLIYTVEPRTNSLLTFQ